ncbi:MAG TPA: hypothetical protein VK152_06640 [Paludibacter sp.]|nr:hypothetical protein [Paludibacter sp.]
MIDDFNNNHKNLTNNKKEYFLARTLKDFGVKVDRGYTYGCIPPPPLRNRCYQPTVDNTGNPPTGEL